MTSGSLTFGKFLIYLLVMALVTYLLRLLPMLFIRKKITNRFIRSVLYYMPYAVLTVMTVPAIFYSTPHLLTSIITTAVAIFLAYRGKSLILVALGSAVTVFVIEMIYLLI